MQSDARYPGWEQGWAVVKGIPDHWTVDGVYDTEDEAKAACAAKGAGYEVRWGSYDPKTKDFVTGDPD
jgi:hypothetical protein